MTATQPPAARIRRALGIAAIVSMAGGAAAAQTAGPTTQPGDRDRDRAAVEATMRAYRDAWLSNDAALVMATIAPDAVIYPSTLPPIAGTSAIQAFWFPAAGPPTRVVAMTLSIDDVHVDGDTAIASGTGSLTYVIGAGDGQAAPRTQQSWHVNVLRRQPGGEWRIWRRMWGNHARPRRVDAGPPLTGRHPSPAFQAGPPPPLVLRTASASVLSKRKGKGGRHDPGSVAPAPRHRPAQRGRA